MVKGEKGRCRAAAGAGTVQRDNVVTYPGTGLRVMVLGTTQQRGVPKRLRMLVRMRERGYQVPTGLPVLVLYETR